MQNHRRILKGRRQFLKTGITFSALFSLFGQPLLANQITTMQKSFHPLRILILGGTSFLGPHQIAFARSRGHAITIFTRGKTKSTIHKKLFKEVEHLIGDREDNLAALKGRKWDAVIDNSGRKAKWTRDTATLLRDTVDLYLYTSSTGVYYPYLGSNLREDRKLLLEVPKNITEIEELEYGYGVMKTNSEIETKRAFGEDRSIIVRPTYMMGPGDRTDRFTYWPVRLSRGGEILVPGKVQDPVQYIDARDVAAWMIRLIENRTTGTFNAVGPASATSMQAFVYGAHASFNSAASFVQVPDYTFLEKHQILDAVPWIMPTGNNAGSALVNNELAVANGLTFTPLATSIRDLYDWWNSEAVSEERRQKMVTGEKGLMAREAEVIKAWRNRGR